MSLLLRTFGSLNFCVNHSTRHIWHNLVPTFFSFNLVRFCHNIYMMFTENFFLVFFCFVHKQVWIDYDSFLMKIKLALVKRKWEDVERFEQVIPLQQYCKKKWPIKVTLDIIFLAWAWLKTRTPLIDIITSHCNFFLEI